MMKLQRFFIDGPFKRRRRRHAVACSTIFILLAWCIMISGVSTFIPLPLRHRTTPFHTHYRAIGGVKSVQSRTRPLAITLLSSSQNANDEAKDDTKSSRIPPEQLELIKESADIVSVVESYGLPGFKRHGDNRALAICPFHNDHNPSMSIDGQRGIYKCFACGAGGDVFNFVREYSALQSEPMTFYQAVRHVAQEFTDQNLKLDISSSSSSTRMTNEERKALKEKKERILLANAAAAAFYAKCLVTVPAAGAARSHLQARGISPTTVKAFGMGYAPDGYFRDKGEWGKGSLVEHLRNLEFTPTEMIEAGLATRTKGAQWKDSENNNSTRNDTDDSDKDYSTLIDRFRNRLVVPIFDSKRANVLGFGGRILPPEETDSSGYKSPRYINSPESPVFQKKNLLFGQHYAKEAVAEMRAKRGSNEAGPNRGSVVLVEGYMDTILLWEAGIHEAVASMGTALTEEQLSGAARTAGTHGGRIVLCFDADEAGVNAIERLCTGSLLSKTAETYVVEILIATLPTNVKDPGEYIESVSPHNKARSGENFRKQVIDEAIDWSAWYLNKLLSRYDETAFRGTAGSFADICDRISDFLSRFSNPAERTKRAHDVAGSLAEVVSGEDAGASSNALRIQLETDLVNMVSRKATARESLKHRIESVQGYSEDATQKLAKMTGGDGMNMADDSSKLSGRALRALTKSDSALKPTREGEKSFRKVESRKNSFSKEGGSSRRKRTRLQRQGSKKIVQPPLTPHFSGFDFANPTDVDWLDIPREKWKRKKQHLTLGAAMDSERYAGAKAAREGEQHIPGLFREDLVYFNSNGYHGEHFITEDAVFAGYSNSEVSRDAAIFEQGVGTLVRQDADTLVDAAERKLLRNIVHFDRARMAMIHSLATGDATGSPNRIEWSQPERAWLFDRLVENIKTIPKHVLVDGRTKELYSHLASLPDVPVGALAEIPLHADADPKYGDSSENISRIKTNAIADISSSIEDLDTPSDSGDIESWAASYDPTVFDDADTLLDLDDALDEDTLPTTSYGNVPQESKATTVEAESSTGYLDEFFVVQEDVFASTYDNTVPRELRAELEVQEAHATLLRATALKRFAAVNAEWHVVGQVLTARLEELDASDNEHGITTAEKVSKETGKNVSDLESMSLDALKEYCSMVASKMRDAAETVHHLDVSAKRIGSRLMDYSNADGIEGRLSISQQEELASMVDNHVNSLPENWKAPDGKDNRVDRFHNNREPPTTGWGDDFSLDNVECFENDMLQISDDWGEWADDDFVWSPEGNFNFSRLLGGTADNVPNVLDNYELEARLEEEEDESLESALHRLDTEWAIWDQDDVPQTAVDAKESSANEGALSDKESEGEVSVADFDSVFE